MDSPFIFGKMVLKNEFTDREKEMEWLKRNLLSGVNSILISPRRWGKTSLVNQTVENIKQEKKGKYIVCSIDLFNIRNEQEFYETLVRETIKASSTKWEEMVDTAKTLFRKIIPKITLSTEQNSEFSLSLNWDEIKQNADEILDFPERICAAKNIKMIICLDEFQNISFFDDQLAFQKKLRAHWQRHSNTTYCLYGSKRHLLMDFFTSPSMPFYKFGDIYFMEKIPLKHWLDFIPDRFNSTGKSISRELAAEIAEKMEVHPSYVQQYAQKVWFLSGKKVMKKHLDIALELLLDQHSLLYQRETEQITNLQLNLLRAIAEGQKSLTTREVIEKYGLKSSANVIKMRNALEQKELIDTMGEEIIFIDPLFKIWLNMRYFKGKNYPGRYYLSSL
jgi:uncharacterized protein